MLHDRYDCSHCLFSHCSASGDSISVSAQLAVSYVPPTLTSDTVKGQLSAAGLANATVTSAPALSTVASSSETAGALGYFAGWPEATLVTN